MYVHIECACVCVCACVRVCVHTSHREGVIGVPKAVAGGVPWAPAILVYLALGHRAARAKGIHVFALAGLARDGAAVDCLAHRPFLRHAPPARELRVRGNAMEQALVPLRVPQNSKVSALVHLRYQVTVEDTFETLCLCVPLVPFARLRAGALEVGERAV